MLQVHKLRQEQAQVGKEAGFKEEDRESTDIQAAEYFPVPSPFMVEVRRKQERESNIIVR